MEWHPATTKPAHGACVIGLILHRYENAPWTWSGPYVYVYERDRCGRDTFVGYDHNGYDGPHQLLEPDVWSAIELPAIPDTDAHRAAIAKGAALDKLREQEARIKAQMHALMVGPSGF